MVKLNSTKRQTAAAIAAAASGAMVLCSGASRAAGATLDSEQYSYTVTFAAGSQSATSVAITPTTPTGKVFVIQTISTYRFPANTSTLQTFVATTFGGQTGYFALPDISGGTTDFYPAATANLTAYVTAGTNAYVNVYRTGGGGYPAETDYITVSGYLTPGV